MPIQMYYIPEQSCRLCWQTLSREAICFYRRYAGRRQAAELPILRKKLCLNLASR
ncbi:hypothetical protein ACXZ7E_29745 [Paenibacillus lautus]